MSQPPLNEVYLEELGIEIVRKTTSRDGVSYLDLNYRYHDVGQLAALTDRPDWREHARFWTSHPEGTHFQGTSRMYATDDLQIILDFISRRLLEIDRVEKFLAGMG